MRLLVLVIFFVTCFFQSAKAYGVEIQPNIISKDISYSIDKIGTNDSSVSGKTTDWRVRFWVPYDADVVVKFFNLADTIKQPPVSVPDYSDRLIHIKKSSKDVEHINVLTIGDEKPIFGAIIISEVPRPVELGKKTQEISSATSAGNEMPQSLVGEWRDTMQYALLIVKSDGLATYKTVKGDYQKSGKIKVLTPTQFEIPFEGLVRLKDNGLYDKNGKILKYRKVN